MLDLFCLFLWSDEGQCEIVGISAIASPSVVGVMRFSRRKVLRLLFAFSSSLPLPFLAQTRGLYPEPVVGGVGFPSVSFGGAGDESAFHKPVEFAE